MRMKSAHTRVEVRMQKNRENGEVTVTMSDCNVEAQMREDGVGRVEARNDGNAYLVRFYIGMGWPGYNSPENKDGYPTAEEALAASKRREGRRNE